MALNYSGQIPWPFLMATTHSSIHVCTSWQDALYFDLNDYSYSGETLTFTFLSTWQTRLTTYALQ
jgi:hypothetical protein